VKYRSGYKYQLAEAYVIDTDITPPYDISTEYIDLYADGRLVIRNGYAWDGPSGPTVDTKNFMTPSLVHDALYQLMRQGHLSGVWRYFIDKLLIDMCKERKMCGVRRWWVNLGVRWFAGFAAKEENAKKVIEVV